jgi:hypothetical protein
MVDNSTDTGKQPVVRGVVKHENVVRRNIIAADAAPAFTNQRSDTSHLDSLKDHFRELIRIINDDRPKAYIDRGLPCFKKFYEVFRGFE